MYTKESWTSKHDVTLGYLKYLPKEYESAEKLPLVLFLHGAGERGTDLDAVARHGIMKHVGLGKEYPFVCIAPQCPNEKYWGCFTESLLEFLDEMTATLKIDTDRVYITGLSMGGTGTWMLAMADPDRFAAIAPVCGSGIYWYGGALKEVPVYAIHGDCDETVPTYESVNMVGSVNKKGGNGIVKILPGVGHNAWEQAYGDDELTDWLLSHKKKRSTEEV